MAESKIEWTDRSDWNPIRGCTRVSNGCGGPGDQGGCYAEAMAARFSNPGNWGHGFAEMRGGKPRWTGKVELQEDRLTLPLRWRKPAKIFVSSTSDVFHEKLPDEAVDKIFAVMALCPQHTFQIITKRPERMRAYFTQDDGFGRWGFVEHQARRIAREQGTPVPSEKTLATFGGSNLPNVWLGTSCEDQATADKRIPDILATPAAVRFLSLEPLLGPIDLTSIPWALRGFRPDRSSVRERYNALTGADRREHLRTDGTWNHRRIDAPDGNPCWSTNCGPKINWAIVGGESGPHARPMHPDWARSLRDQCAAAGVPFFFKQWGEWAFEGQKDADGRTIVWPSDCESFNKLGKKRAGRLLDGIEHNSFPAPSP
ncbi:MAG TPA: phage Gp37/Gp68 family protein [Rhizomicrobium sp.]|nr:phage Gp37/Gp68 family protein [Rhizomicrobium sp.]